MTAFESAEDETILLGAVLALTNPDPDILDRIEPEWMGGLNATIWQLARECRNESQPVTPRNIRARSGGNPVLSAKLDTLAGQSWPAGRVRIAEATVAELYRCRRLQGALTASLERLQAAGTYSEALESAHAELERLEGSQAPQSVSRWSDVYDRWADAMNATAPHLDPIATPWPDLDARLAGGVHRGRTYVIGGRPGEGKSLGGVNLAIAAATSGHPTVVFSVEMGEHEIASRIVAAGAKAEYTQITRREVDDYNHDRIQAWTEDHHDMPLWLVDKTDIGVEYVTSVCRTLKRTQGLDVVFVDYLQLLKPGLSKVARQEQIAHMSRALKTMAMDLNVAVIVACQLNRNSANEKRAPQLSDLRESGAIEQDCDAAILLHHILDDSGEHSGNVDLILAKARIGKPGTVRCRWKAYQARIAPA